MGANLLMHDLVDEWNEVVKPMLQGFEAVLLGIGVLVFVAFVVFAHMGGGSKTGNKSRGIDLSTSGKARALVGSRYSSEDIHARASEREGSEASAGQAGQASREVNLDDPELREVSQCNWGRFEVHEMDDDVTPEERYLPMTIGDSFVVKPTGKEGEYLVTNEELRNGGLGMQYRFTTDMEDRDTSSICHWETKVQGVEEEEGWLKCQAMIPKRSLVPGSSVPVSQVKKVNGVAWLKRADQDDGGHDAWLHVHDNGVQLYYPLTEDGERDLDFRLSEIEDHRSKFSSNAGARLTHMILLKAGKCNVSGQPLAVGTTVLRDDRMDWNMSLAEAEERGLSAELTRTSLEGAYMTPVKPKGVTKCSAPGCRKTISNKLASADGCLAGCNSSAPAAAPTAASVVFVPLGADGLPNEASDFKLCAGCMERSPEFNKAGAVAAQDRARSTAAVRAAQMSYVQARELSLEPEAPPGAETYVYVPQESQRPRDSGWDPDTPRSISTPRKVPGQVKEGFSKYERFHVVDKTTTKGTEWLKLASGGWVSTCKNPREGGARIVFPLDEAISNGWIPTDDQQ